MKIRILLALPILLLLCVSAHGQCAGVTTCTAISSSAADVQNALNSINLNNTTLNVPAGTSTWMVTVNYNGTFSISIIGASTVATTNAQGNPATFNDLTNIVDGFGGPLFHMNGSGTSSQVIRISGFSITQTAQGTYELSMFSGGQVRFDHNHFTHLNPIARVFFNPQTPGGVADHNLASGNAGAIDNEIQVWGSGGTSQISWNSATQLGSPNFFFIENNTFTEGFGNDCIVGGRNVMRFNTLTVSTNAGGSFQSHATGSVQDSSFRGCRAWEVYKNVDTSSFTGGSFAFDQQFSGTGVHWGNTVTNFSHSLYMVNDRDQLQTNYTQVPPPNGFGYCGTFQTGITSAWDGNQNTGGSNGWPCMDQPGRGQGDLLSGAFPNFCNSTLGCSTFNGQWPRQALEPIYVWGESFISGSGLMVQGNSPENNILNNRDFYFQCDSNNSSCPGGFTGALGTGSGTLASRPATCSPGVAYFATDQGNWNSSGSGGQGVLYKCTATNTWTLFYTPFTYPHPLVSGTGTPTIGFSPSPAAFGNQIQGTTSAPLSVTVSNSGTAPQVFATPYFTITGTNATNFANAGTGTCANGASLAVSASCTINLTFTPSATGARTATLNVQGTVNASDNLTGTGTGPILSLAPSPAAFGNQNVGTTSGGLTVTVSNTGTGTQTLSTPFFTVTGTNASDFARSGGTCANAGTIAASASCTIILTFTPGAAGARSANLNIQGTVNGIDSLTGTGIQPALTITPSPGAFGNQNVSTTSGPLTITVTNSGTAAEILGTPYFTLTGTNSADFSNAGTGSCANGGTIAVSSSCTVNLTFTPAASGSRTATLNILGTVNGADSLTGTGIAPFALLSPLSIAFANQTTNTSSGNHAVTLTNSGTATLTITSISLSGADAGQFSTNGSTCGASLAPTISCNLNVVFAPTTVGSKSASLVFVTSAASSPDSVALTGAGVAPAVPVLSFSPGLGSFGNQLVNTTSSPLTITISNTGTATEVLNSPFFTLTGPNASEFARTAGTCVNGGTIAVSASCTITLTFTPAGTGGRAAALNISGTANGSAALSGTGILPVIGLSPSPGAFGNQLQGTTSGPLTITVSNTGTATEVLATPFFTITGTNSSNFANAGSGTCVNGGSIAVSSSCTINLTFTPSATGARTATLNVQGTVNASDSLTGTGTLPVIGLAPSPAAFGNQNVGGTSSPVTVTVSNTGTGTQTLSTPFFTITGTNAADFARSGGTCANAGTIAASGSCTILLTFTPGASGSRSATLNIQGTVNATDSFTGTGIASAVSLSPTSIAFGNQTTGTTSGTTAVTLTNPGTATLNISSIALTGANSGEFTLTGSTCGSTLAVSASCGLNVAFSPATLGAKTANLTFTTDAASSPNNIPLTGTGTAVAVPVLSFSPTPVAFGNQTQGTTSGATTLTVSNTGTAAEILATPYFTITGANASSFANSGAGTCVNGGTIAVSGSCTVTLTFTPSTTGALAGTLNILGTVNGSNNMTGTGTPVAPAAVSLSPTTINYGNQDDGTSSPPTSVTLTNTGSGTLNITSIVLTGANSTEFSINTNTCGATLAASASCTWNVVFSPATAGSKSASVTVTTNAATSPDHVTLTGTGRVPTPPTTPAPAITIVTILPPGSVVVNATGSGVTPRNSIVTPAGCSQDSVHYQNPCQFLISCGNCSKTTTVRWNGTQISQTFSRGTITAFVPASMIPAPLVPTDYQISLLN